MKEFRKARIQREVAEILATIDQARQPPRVALPARPRFRPHPRQVGLAVLSCLLGVLMGQSIAMKAMETGSREPFQFTPASFSEARPVTQFDYMTFPELPEIEIIYVPNLAQAGRLAEVQI